MVHQQGCFTGMIFGNIWRPTSPRPFFGMLLFVLLCSQRSIYFFFVFFRLFLRERAKGAVPARNLPRELRRELSRVVLAVQGEGAVLLTPSLYCTRLEQPGSFNDGLSDGPCVRMCIVVGNLSSVVR